MRVLAATVCFLAAGYLLPVAGVWIYAARHMRNEERSFAMVLGVVYWTIPAVFGALVYHVALWRRCRLLGTQPRAWAAVLLGLVFSGLPLLLIPAAHAVGSGTKAALWSLPFAAAALAMACAYLTPLRTTA